jgi:hypothetical protein
MQRALDFARWREDRWRELECAVWLATMALERADYNGAAVARDAMARAGAPDCTRGAMQALISLASGDPGSPPRLREGLAGIRALDDKARLSHLQNVCAELLLDAGDREPAKWAADEALEAARALGRPTEIAVATALLARIDAANGTPAAGMRRLHAIDREFSSAARSSRAHTPGYRRMHPNCHA